MPGLPVMSYTIYRRSPPVGPPSPGSRSPWSHGDQEEACGVKNHTIKQRGQSRRRLCLFLFPALSPLPRHMQPRRNIRERRSVAERKASSAKASFAVQVRDQVAYLVIRQLLCKRRHLRVRTSELPEDVLRGGRQAPHGKGLPLEYALQPRPHNRLRAVGRVTAGAVRLEKLSSLFDRCRLRPHDDTGNCDPARGVRRPRRGPVTLRIYPRSSSAWASEILDGTYGGMTPRAPLSSRGSRIHRIKASSLFKGGAPLTGASASTMLPP